MRIGIKNILVLDSKPVNRTANACRCTVENMGIDHRRFDIGMTQKLLNSSNIVS